jgi:hypothetical protein
MDNFRSSWTIRQTYSAVRNDSKPPMLGVKRAQNNNNHYLVTVPRLVIAYLGI